VADLVAGSATHLWVLHLIHAFFDGLRRVWRAPTLMVGVYLITLIVAAPLTLTLHDAIASHLGESVSAEEMVTGVHWDWWEEFRAQSDELGSTFIPSVIGFAAVLSNLASIFDAVPLPSALVAVIVLYLAFWSFLIGGILDRLARQRRVTNAAFFSACGTYFFRFCRLAGMAGFVYWAIFSVLHGWLFEDLYEAVTRNLTVERTTFLIRLTLYGVFGGVLALANLVFDYAKIRAVVEDRHSMIGALLGALRFVRRHPKATFGLYLLNGMLVVLVLVGYALTAPLTEINTPSIWTPLLIGQAYVVARLFTKLTFYASQTAYFQSQLAHAGYVAAPRPVWPESPAAEAITNSTL